MSIDNIHLPAFLIQSIFGNNLVDASWDVPANDSKTEPGISFLGGNEKKIAFLFNDDKNKFLADVQVKFLNDLLAACKLTMADVALVNFFIIIL